MQFHRNAKLGLAGRRELVLAIAGGSSIREAAATFNVSTATAHRWWQRWRQSSEQERRSLSCLFDRSSRPAHSPRRLAPELERTICECRRPRPVKWCLKLRTPSSLELYAATSMAITSSACSPGGASALAIDSILM